MNIIILHEGRRVDNNELVIGFVTKMWGQYHILTVEDENTGYLVKEDTIKPNSIIDSNGIRHKIDSINDLSPFDLLLNIKER